MQPRNPSYTMNPDMVAFTIGRISLYLMRTAGKVSTDLIHETLHQIMKSGTKAGVTPEMACSALRLVVREKEHELRVVA